MNPEKDILSEAIEQVRAEPVEPGPPQALMEATLAELAAASGNTTPRTTTYVKLASRFAVAAAVLLIAGYAAGRLTAPSPPDIDQLKAELAVALTEEIEPIVRQNVTTQLNRQYEVIMANGFARIQADLQDQYQMDLNRFAVQLLAASNARTNEILGQLVQNIKTAETKKMLWVTEALQEIDRSHRQEQSKLAAGLQTLAHQTKNGFEQTREELVQLLANTYPSTVPPNAENNKEERDL